MDFIVILSSFSHSRLTKLAALIQKSPEVKVEKIMVKIIKLEKPEICQAIQGMCRFVIVCREITADLQKIRKDIIENGGPSCNIFTFDEIDKAIEEPDTFGSSICRRIHPFF